MSREREIFLTALEISDRERRAAYLDDACEDAAIRKRVSKMLAFDEESDFLRDDALTRSSIRFESGIAFRFHD